MTNYFAQFETDEKVIRSAVGEIFGNYRLADEVSDSTNKRVTYAGTTYGHGSKEPIPGVVRKPGTRREGKGPQRKQRWAQS